MKVTARQFELCYRCLHPSPRDLLGEQSNGIRSRKEGVHVWQAECLRRLGVLMGYAESDPEGQARVVTLREGIKSAQRSALGKTMASDDKNTKTSPSPKIETAVKKDAVIP